MYNMLLEWQVAGPTWPQSSLDPPNRTQKMGSAFHLEIVGDSRHQAAKFHVNNLACCGHRCNKNKMGIISSESSDLLNYNAHTKLECNL